MLAVDVSASMGYADGRGVGKLQVARLLAAALAYLLVQQGDAVGLVSHDERIGASLPARTGRAHLVRVLGALADLQTHGGTDLAAGVRRAAARLGRRGCIVLLSDLFGDDGWDTALREMRRMGHEVVVFHVLTPEEHTLPPGGDMELVDLETGERVVTNAARVRDVYTASMAAFVAQQRARAHAEGITYVEAGTDRGVDTLLREFTRHRAPQAGRGR